MNRNLFNFILKNRNTIRKNYHLNGFFNYEVNLFGIPIMFNLTIIRKYSERKKLYGFSNYRFNLLGIPNVIILVIIGK